MAPWSEVVAAKQLTHLAIQSSYAAVPAAADLVSRVVSSSGKCALMVGDMMVT